MGNLFTVTGCMNHALLLAGCKIKKIYPRILPLSNYEEEWFFSTYMPTTDEPTVTFLLSNSSFASSNKILKTLEIVHRYKNTGFIFQVAHLMALPEVKKVLTYKDLTTPMLNIGSLPACLLSTLINTHFQGFSLTNCNGYQEGIGSSPHLCYFHETPFTKN